jgi:hypothetical protein
MNIYLLVFNVDYIQYNIWKINLKLIHFLKILFIYLVLGDMVISRQASFI